VIVHLVTLIVAISPLGEWFMRLLEGVRKVEIYGEASYINPLFAEVYYEVSKKYPKLSKKVQVYIKDEATINAYAFGSNTIVITRGALETLDEDQLKGFLAHEFGHLVNQDTRILLALTIGGGFFNIFYWLFKLIIRVLDFFIRFYYVRTFFKLFFLLYLLPLKFIRFILVKVNWLFETISALIIGAGSRSNQYRADEMAVQAGYKEHLLSALYLLHEMNIIDNQSLMERLKSGSPHLASRIARLEKMR
jgi:heat shock protein HtpX